jgi:NAD(P)-dependent dehydrogenase (short-subunit alcohol dehydrogenase family)
VILEGKTAIVTGAGGGIGEAIARRFAQEGARVTVADIDASGGERVVAEIQEAGGAAQFVKANVAEESDITQMADATVRTYGAIDVLVNNAGILRFTPIESLTREQWDLVVGVNLTGPAFCCKHVLPHMRAAGGGSIINVSSINAAVTAPTFAAYASSKTGLLGLTRSLALELGPENIRVNAILPGYIRTPLFMSDAIRLGEGNPDRFIGQLEPRIPLRRIGTPEDVAGVALFLASDDSAYVNGAALSVDAGVAVQL